MSEEEIKARRRARAVKAIIPLIVKLAPGVSIEQVVRAVEKEL